MKSFEKYSSTIESFSVLGSLSYPTKEWVDLGNYSVSEDSLVSLLEKQKMQKQQQQLGSSTTSNQVVNAGEATGTGSSSSNGAPANGGDSGNGGGNED